ncbi:MAG: 2-succinyl-5-enolpyruvyl-6-hydroxy-3-cyclohexene-1-carboxylic-acid synthase [Verrucomicrobiales bacterium]|nr:2-succinyl-5-enolpyruvyl-6-hydroxy-3-cyclohexene-1-carboxylic-acid synthase [Verrucomicrobiales bacterium]MCP5558226.1 2-succinyl-5-enolpyruvyl-6-hydroxy-3-cyclohexene-1-carboxylic-acid synthase [Verrucomicrobiaceae bacterium]
MSASSPNAQIIAQLLRYLADSGVREVCVAAGARNAPLVAALAASQGVKLWNFFEERCAAFFALGRIMTTQRPVAVVVTSGTAAAELLPAAIEARYQGLPLILVTADRPKSYRGTGAPQSIDQACLFGSQVLAAFDLDEGDAGSWVAPQEILRGPVQVNVCLAEPLETSPSGWDFTQGALPPPAGDAEVDCAASAALLRDWIDAAENLVVVAAGLHPAEAADVAPFLSGLQAPIIADATANLSGFAELQDLLLAGGERTLHAIAPTAVLRIGGVPSWRWWRDLEDDPAVSVVNLCSTGFPGLARRENVRTLPWGTVAKTQVWQWPEHCSLRMATHRAVAKNVRSKIVAAMTAHPLAEPSWMASLRQRIPAGSRVFLGNSLPIREWDVACGDVCQVTFANRGANGIDGLVSTFLGCAVDTEEAWLILGDLSALYDLAAPWIIDQIAASRLRIVVINNGGGKIFARVPGLKALPEEVRSIVENRHALSFEAWAKLWNLDYHLATTTQELDVALPDVCVIEVRPDAVQTEAFWASL